jgi:Ca-activated chloride channel homolog
LVTVRRALSLGAGVVAGAVTLLLVAFFLPASPVVRASCVTIVVNSSTEKGGLIADLGKRYNQADRVFGGNCAKVETYQKTSGATMDALNKGWDPARDESPAPQVWLPSTSLWAELLEYRTKKDFVTGEKDSITTSPLVIAMPEKMASALGWPEKQLGWADLRALANDRDWGKRGHPEWGRFAMGKDNPRLSTSGLAATIATNYAATKNVGGFTPENLTANADVTSFVRNVESSVAHYSDDSVVFLGNLYAEDQKKTEKPYISAMVIQEQMAFLYNNGAPTGNPADLGKNPRPNDPLVAIHPADGTVMIDHPFLVMSDATPEQRAAAADFRDFLLEPEQQASFVAHGFRDSNGQAGDELAQSVGTRSKQKPPAIMLPGPAEVQAMLDGWDAARRRGTVLLMLDVSKSMDDPSDPGATTSVSKLQLLKPAVKRGLELLDDDDEVALWTFSSEPDYTVVRPMTPVGPVREELTQQVDNLRAGGNTALYNTTAAAQQQMIRTLDPNRINAIVVLTDGNDTVRGGVSQQQLLDSIDATYLDTSVRIFTIAYGKDADSPALARIAEKSKGRAYDASDPSNIDKVFVSVFSNF